MANDLVKGLRVPVLLAPGDHDVRLDPTFRETEPVQALLRPYPADEMMGYPISSRINTPANDFPECVEPLM